jgi:hypothetical protein
VMIGDPWSVLARGRNKQDAVGKLRQSGVVKATT